MKLSHRNYYFPVQLCHIPLQDYILRVPRYLKQQRWEALTVVKGEGQVTACFCTSLLYHQKIQVPWFHAEHLVGVLSFADCWSFQAIVMGKLLFSYTQWVRTLFQATLRHCGLDCNWHERSVSFRDTPVLILLFLLLSFCDEFLDVK